VTRNGASGGLFLPLDMCELPAEVRRGIFLRLSEQPGGQLDASGVSESQVLGDFTAARGRT